MDQVQFRSINKVNDYEAQCMFAWEKDPNFADYCVVCSDPRDPPKYQSWKDLQQSLNSSGTTRFGMYLRNEFVGEFNFVFDHPALLVSEPKSAWIGIGIGPSAFRGPLRPIRALPLSPVDRVRSFELMLFELL